VTPTWDEFDPSWLSVVTFNYDRSLEQFLHVAIRSTYGKGDEEVRERLSRLEFVHVYGSLGPLHGEKAIPFGGYQLDEDVRNSIQRAATDLVVIPEGREDAPSLRKAQQLLTDAAKICILGFSYDETNVRRLGAPRTFNTVGGAPKLVMGTAYGLTKSQANRARSRLFQSHNYGEQLVDCNCSGLLTTTLILG